MSVEELWQIAGIIGIGLGLTILLAELLQHCY
jgi:hypothetical protein